MNAEPIALANAYRIRLGRVLSYVDAHLDERPSAEDLADVAGFSRFHFHRQFTAAFGISVQRYVQTVRLKRAGYRLAFRDGEPITEIAFAAGYESPEAFARAFKQRFGRAPTAFRHQPDWSLWNSAYEPVRATRRMQMGQGSDVRIIDTNDVRVATLEHRGDPAKIGDSLRRFIAWRKAVGLSPKVSATFNVLYDDPEATPPDEFRLDVCAATDAPIAPNEAEIVAKTIPGGRCATFRYTGSDDGFGPALVTLYRDWLAASGEELRDFPLYCQRVKFFPDVPEHEAVTDFFLPLK